MLPVMDTGNRMSRTSRRDYLQRIYPRYQKARRAEKQRILDEFCANCSYHRKHAIRLLNHPLGGETEAPAATPRSNLRSGHAVGFEGGLGGSRLSLVVALEGLVAGVDALDSPPFPAGRWDRATTVTHQRTQYRLPPARREAPAAAPALRPHQAGELVEASHPAQ